MPQLLAPPLPKTVHSLPDSIARIRDTTKYRTILQCTVEILWAIDTGDSQQPSYFASRSPLLAQILQERSPVANGEKSMRVNALQHGNAATSVHRRMNFHFPYLPSAQQRGMMKAEEASFCRGGWPYTQAWASAC